MKLSPFVSHDGKDIQLYTWGEVKRPKAVVKIAHGMAEHSARYDDFARYLNTQGYIVVMNDHRGHGLSCEKDSLGYEEGDMFENNVLDQLALLDYCRKQYDLPVFLMGHSYGSFVTQAVIERDPDANGFVLCGSNYIKGLQYSACGVIARHMCRNKGGRYPAELIAKLSFGSYEKRFPGTNAWLNRDEREVAKYNDDELCGFTCSANFYRSFMQGISGLYNKENYEKIDVSKPLMIIAGGEDPVGNYGKGVEKLHKFYTEKVGVGDVSLHIYEGARHEILNELNKADVYSDIAQWLNAHVNAGGEDSPSAADDKEEMVPNRRFFRKK